MAHSASLWSRCNAITRGLLAILKFFTAIFRHDSELRRSKTVAVAAFLPDAR